MAVLSAAEIYAIARSAGFGSADAVTWTAIALAESRGDTEAHAGSGEDSWGLWQINVAPGVRPNRWGDLTDPRANARAAFEISRRGADMTPWTVTHDSVKGTNRDYRRFLPEAQAAARGVPGTASGDDNSGDVSPELVGYDRIGSGAPVASADSDRDGLTDEFERVAGTDPRAADSDRDGLSDGFEGVRSHTDPLRADTDRDSVPDAVEWARGGDAGHLGGIAGVAGAGALRQSVRGGVPDADRDGLSDRYEQLLGTDPGAADSDADALPDALERALGTNPLAVDTDADGVTDGLEVRLHEDPLRGAGGVVPVPFPAGPTSVRPGGLPADGVPEATGVVPAPRSAGGAASSDAVHRFLRAALAQSGDRYAFGAEAQASDTDPDAFDCSELTQWASRQAGVELPDGSAAQYLALKEHGALIPVEQAIRTPGALLFHFSTEPVPGGGRPRQAHVAISLGNGQTIEARGRAYGVGEFSAAHRFTYAAVIPGLHTSGMGSSPFGYDQIGSGAPVASADSDRDGLTDEFERVAGTDPGAADSDRDGLSDGFEGVRSHTDPLRADTDRDSVPDAVEWARGSDAGHLGGIAGVAGAGALRESVRGGVLDADRDGLSDRYERLLGTDPRAVDTDADGVTDALEVRLHEDPLHGAGGVGPFPATAPGASDAIGHDPGDDWDGSPN